MNDSFEEWVTYKQTMAKPKKKENTFPLPEESKDQFAADA